MAKKERWASRMGLVLAMAGNAVGLGNFLRFPAQAAKNGGGAFLIPYLVALVVVGLPLIWVEWGMGRFGGQHGHHSAPGIFQSMGKGRLWKYAGALGLWVCLIIAAYYLYIESWCLAYAGVSLFNGFHGKNPTEVQNFFNHELTGQYDNEILAISGWGMAVFAVCIAINVYILSRGLAKGIELVCKIGMPLLIVFAAILAVKGLTLQPGVDPGVKNSPMEGLNFVWQPKYDSLANPSVWLAAAGQIFFTLSIGMGTIHCYASYLRERDDVVLTGASAGWTNEFCEVVLGGTILIPIAVAYLGLDTVQQEGHFGLGFFFMPTLFDNWGWFGPVAGFLWYGLLFFAAITSSLAMGQPVMAFLQDEFKVSRPRSAVIFALMLLPLAIPVAIFHGDTFFTEFDDWGGTFALVVFAMIEIVLFAWVFGMKRGKEEIEKGAEMKVPAVFYFIMKYVTPVFLLVILVGFFFKPEGKVTVTDEKTGMPKIEKRGWQPYIAAPFGGPTPPEWEWADDSFLGRAMHKDVDTKIAAAGSDEKKVAYLNDVKVLRDVDRVVMIALYLGLAALVYIAWKRNHRGKGVAT